VTMKLLETPLRSATMQESISLTQQKSMGLEVLNPKWVKLLRSLISQENNLL